MKKAKLIAVEVQPPQLTEMARRKFLPAVLERITPEFLTRKLETHSGGKFKERSAGIIALGKAIPKKTNQMKWSEWRQFV